MVEGNVEWGTFVPVSPGCWQAIEARVPEGVGCGYNRGTCKNKVVDV